MRKYTWERHFFKKSTLLIIVVSSMIEVSQESMVMQNLKTNKTD